VDGFDTVFAAVLRRNMEDPTMKSASLTALLDRQSISDCLARYARGVDRVDEELIRSAFWEDAHDAHGAFEGSPQEFVAWFVPTQGTREVAQHFLMNQSVQLDGEVADVETYFISMGKQRGSDVIESVGGRYVDLFEKRNGEWRVKTRIVLLDWQSVGDASNMTERLSRSNRGSRDRTDPSYERLGAAVRTRTGPAV
jgi:hypothetical protein